MYVHPLFLYMALPKGVGWKNLPADYWVVPWNHVASYNLSRLQHAQGNLLLSIKTYLGRKHGILIDDFKGFHMHDLTNKLNIFAGKDKDSQNFWAFEYYETLGRKLEQEYNGWLIFDMTHDFH